MCCYALPNILGLSRNRGGGFVLELIDRVKETEEGRGELGRQSYCTQSLRRPHSSAGLRGAL